MEKRVVLGMSGGVDSSVSALLLKEQGYEVIGITMKLWEEIEDSAEELSSVSDAKRVCKQLGIEHHVVDVREIFRKEVVQQFVEEYERGNTPNPCIVCNHFLKFGAMFELAKQYGAPYIATGHYAKVGYREEYQQVVIQKSNAGKKDQTYVLYSISKDVVPHMLFPLGVFENKLQIRALAEKANLEVAHKADSQDICFIPNNDYVAFLEQYAHMQKVPGKIVDASGKVRGTHNGYFRYTIGQRRGLGIAHPTPLYVVGVDAKNNEVIVGEEQELYKSQIHVRKVNWLVDDVPVDGKIEAKIRYAAMQAPATYLEGEDGTATVVFEEAQRAPTPGQSIVFYKGDVLLGGGIMNA